jgi:hypothetical protein
MKLQRSVTTMLLGCLAMILFIATNAEAQSSRKAEPQKSEIQKSKPGQTPEFSNQAEKDAWVKENLEPKKTNYVNYQIPADQPQKINTGNPAQDEADYLKRKEAYKAEQAKAEQLEMRKAKVEAMERENRIKNFDVNSVLISDAAKVGAFNSQVTYITLDDFNKMGDESRALVIDQINSVVIVSNSNLIPKIPVTQREFDNFPKSRQQEMQNSGRYIIR